MRPLINNSLAHRNWSERLVRRDVHSEYATVIFNKHLLDVTFQERTVAKRAALIDPPVPRPPVKTGDIKGYMVQVVWGAGEPSSLWPSEEEADKVAERAARNNVNHEVRVLALLGIHKCEQEPRPPVKYTKR